MGLAADRRYVSLARRAAGRLGTSNGSIISAILAQWQCELGAGDAYPPRRNNPGNLSRGAAETIGARYTVEFPNPQPGNPIVTFSSPEAGADAYGKLLATTARYADVRAAVRAGDGRAYLQAINRSGYGGSLSCSLAVFGGQAIPGSGGSVGGGGLPAPSGPGGVLVSNPSPADVARELAALQAKLRSIGIDASPTHRFSQAEALLIANKLYFVTGSVADSVAHNWVGKTVLERARMAAGGDVETTTPFPTPGDVVGTLFGDFEWVPGVVANLAVLTAIGVLGYVGLRNLAEGLGEG